MLHINGTFPMWQYICYFFCSRYLFREHEADTVFAYIVRMNSQIIQTIEYAITVYIQ